MRKHFKIEKVYGRRIWDSRGRPTIEVEVHLANGIVGTAIAPAGASTGSGEALDLRDKQKAFAGFGVTQAVNNINSEIAAALVGKNVYEQQKLDQILIQLDGSEQRTRLGANAMIATSMALAHCAAHATNLPLWKYLRGHDVAEKIILPLPEVQIFGGGAHAQGFMDLQDFMVMPYGAKTFSEAMDWVAEIYLAAGALMGKRGKRFGVADEGGFWPAFDSNEDAIESLVKAIELAGFTCDASANSQVGISLDIAASQIYARGAYHLKAEKRSLNTGQWFDLMLKWLKQYPIVAIEDPFVESDLESHASLLKEINSFPRKIQLVGDDLLVTQIKNMEQAKNKNACNTLLCKPNQVGTLSEAKDAFQLAKKYNWNTIVSARSGESEDTTICHLALGWGIEQIKVGSFTRSERMAKWNELIRLEDRLGSQCEYAASRAFKK